MFHIRNLLDRRNVTKKPSHDVNASEDFLLITIKSHILAAVLRLLNHSSLSDMPQHTPEYFPENFAELTSGMQYECLLQLCKDAVSEFVWETFTNEEPESQPRFDSTDDNVLHYAKKFISLGLLYMEYLDGIREGDGLRVQRCLRYLLPVFKRCNRKNYAIEVLHTLYNVAYGLPPCEAHQVVWSRFVNTTGLPGHNIPCDLHMEHLNRLCKDALHMRGRQGNMAVKRVGKVVGILSGLLSTFDKETSVQQKSSAYRVASASEDLSVVVNALVLGQVFYLKERRCHSAFNSQTAFIISSTRSKLVQWMIEHMRPLMITGEVSNKK